MLMPAAAAVVGAVLVWCAAHTLAVRAAGPPGFDVVITDRSGATIAHRRSAQLLTPERAPTPPLGGTLVARATFLAPRAGVYVWQLGASSAASLSVDGVALYSPRPGRVAPKEQQLTAGLHEIEIVLHNADAAGAIAFGVRPPWRPWRGTLAGPGEVVALPLAAVKSRLGAHPVAMMLLLDTAPAAALLIIFFIIWVGVGAHGRARARAYSTRLINDQSCRRWAVAIAFVAIVLPMIWPLFEPGFFACGEEESYIVRLTEYERAIRGGVPMGRWWPDPVLGRGYPFLCVYAPLLYILATPMLLAGVSAIATIKILSGALVVVGSAAIYRIVRRRASSPASMLAAALYLYAPYMQTDVWIREDLAESLGFACFPLAILALERALDATNPDSVPDIAWLSLALAALGCSHNITAYFAVYFLGLWFGLRVVLRTVGKTGIRRAMVGALLGFLLCVFYAIPALVDSKRIWIERVMTGYYNPAGHFLSPLMFFVTEPRWQMRLYLGVSSTLALGLGAAALLLRRPDEPLARTVPTSRTLALLAGSGVLFAFVVATRPLGPFFVKYLPLANHVQFPWRLLLFAASLAPLCVPAALDGFVRSPRGRWLVAAGWIVVLIAALAPNYGPPAPLVRSRLDVVRFLRGLDTDYVTSMNEYLPKTVKRTVPRFDEVAHVVAGKAARLSGSRSPGVYRVVVDTDDVAIVELNAHWFPGWVATIDGRSQAIGPGYNGFDTGGLIRVRVPPGHHLVTIRFVRTTLRWVCDAISLLTLLVLLILLGRASLVSSAARGTGTARNAP